MWPVHILSCVNYVRIWRCQSAVWVSGSIALVFLQEFKGCFEHRLTVSGNIETHGSGALNTFLQAVITPSRRWAPVFEPLFFRNFFSRDALGAFGGWALFFYDKVRSTLQTMQKLLELLQSLKVKLQCGITIIKAALLLREVTPMISTSLTKVLGISWCCFT